MSWMSSSRVLKRAVQRSLRRPAGFCRRQQFLPNGLGAVRPPDQPLGMPGILTDGKVNDERRAMEIDVRGVKLICPLSVRPTGR